MGNQASIWPDGGKCAVSVTYDGALAEHLALVPLLDSLGLRVSFFADPTRLLDDMLGWKRVSEKHEILNHSLFGVADGGTLLNWNVAMVEADVKSTNKLITDYLERPCRAFALPGWSTACSDGDYLPAIQRLFDFIRSERREINDWQACSLGYVGSFPLEDVEPAAIVTEAQKKGGWVVFRMGRIRDNGAHERFLRSLAALASTIWVAPFAEVAERLTEVRPQETATQ